MQERQVAEPVAQPKIADWGFGIDVLLLGEPGDGGLFVAEFVDQLELDALAPGEYATVGDAGERSVVELAAVLHQAAEPGIGIHHDRLDGGERLRASVLQSMW